MWLAVGQFLLAAVSGGVGLWQRYETIGDTPAAYHVWPWPIQFSAVVNFPALSKSVSISGGMGMLWDGWSEMAEMTLALLFVPVFWYWVGGRIEGWSSRRRGVFFAVVFGGSLGLAVALEG